jgi:hypothetical protein
VATNPLHNKTMNFFMVSSGILFKATLRES